MTRQQWRHKFCCNTTHLPFFGQNQVARTFTDSYSAATSRRVRRRFWRITASTFSTWSSSTDVEVRPDLGPSSIDVARFETLVPLMTLRTAQTILSISLLQHVKSLRKMFFPVWNRIWRKLFAPKDPSFFNLQKSRREYQTYTHSSACNSMTNWHGMMLLVSEWSLKSPQHNATIVSVLSSLAASLFDELCFFMDCLRKVWACTEATARRPADRLLHISLERWDFSRRITSPVFPCWRLAFLYAGMWYNRVTNFLTEKRLVLLMSIRRGCTFTQNYTVRSH